MTGKETVFSNSNPGPYEGKETNRLSGENNDRILAIAYLNNEENFGVDKYDIGHVVAAGQEGGKAALGWVCRDNLKAGGMSTFPFRRPVDVFATGTFAHEIGHQFGAHHTFSTNEGPCLEGFSSRGAYEIGSGNTILSYAGACGNNDLQGRRDDYYHAISVQQILGYTTNEHGSACPVLVETNNTPPTVTIREGGFVIPVNTPFTLVANANDEDGDVLMYNWQQFDNAVTQENMIGTVEEGEPMTREEYAKRLPPNTPEVHIDLLYQNYLQGFENSFRGDGPLFRNFRPTTSNKRYFPQLDLVLSGDTSNKEVMPFTSRELNFVINVRDGRGGVTHDLLSFSSTEDAGPFVVTSKFSAPEYAGFSDLLIEWDMAKTNIAPVNCQNVSIPCSTDGGKSFDITLLERTANDGSETVRLPNIATSEARIMVKAVDNIFFHVNDRDFNITQSEVTAPEASTRLIARKVTAREIKLLWTDNSEVEDGFIIEKQSANEVDFVEIGRTVGIGCCFLHGS